MPTNFLHHHHGADGKSASSTHRHTYGGNPSSYSTTTRQTSSTATAGSRSAGVSADQLQRFDVLFRRAENRECFDCGAKQPRWASTNLGIFFCLRCAGIHRSMGTHISKVKSTNMDAWEESMIQVMEHIGNARGRLLYEFNMPNSARVTSATDTSIVERAIRAKYEKRTYYNPRFDDLFAEFMEKPIDGAATTITATAVTEAASSPALNAPPRRAPPPSQSSPQPQLDELWGAPVASPTANPANPPASAGSTTTHHNVTSVAELFSGTRPTGAASGPRGAWGSSPSPHENAYANSSGRAAPNGSTGSAFVSPTSATNSDWFDSNFGGSNGNPRASGAPSPASPHSPANGPASRSNTDDLFQGSGGTPSSGRNAGTKDEIMSLFGSAPMAGAGGQSRNAQASPNSNHPMAWQPQTVKPYYYPE